jgi:hypothetical protein
LADKEGDMTRFGHFKLLSPIILIFIVTLLAPSDSAARYENITTSLQLIREIYVDVKPIQNPIVQDAGIDESFIRDLAEKQLRKAGIKLLNREQYDRYKMTLSYPLARLEVRLTVHEIEGMDAAFVEIRTRVMQVVFLSRRPIVQINAPSWEVQEIGIVRDPSFVEDALKRSLDVFIDDYFTANPP